MKWTVYQIFVAAIIGLWLLSMPRVTVAATSTTATNYISVLGSLHIFGANMGFADTDPRTIIAQLVRTFMGFVGIIMLIMILSSGVQFMISGGNDEKVASAKKTFVNSLIGLIIILSAYSIVAYMLGAFAVASL